MRKKFLLTSMLCLLHAGCSSIRPAWSDFPIVELKYRDRTELVNLLSDYGYIANWPQDRQPSFYVFNRKHRSRVKTHQWEHFVKELKLLPDGIEIDAVSKCTVHFAWGMPDSKRKELRQVLDEKSIRVVDSEDRTKHVLFCSCKTREFRVLYDEER